MRRLITVLLAAALTIAAANAMAQGKVPVRVLLQDEEDADAKALVAEVKEVFVKTNREAV